MALLIVSVMLSGCGDVSTDKISSNGQNIDTQTIVSNGMLTYGGAYVKGGYAPSSSACAGFTYGSSSDPNVFIHFSNLVDDWHLHQPSNDCKVDEGCDWQTVVANDFKKIHEYYGATFIRFKIHPTFPSWQNCEGAPTRPGTTKDDVGIVFPHPAATAQGQQEMANLRAIIDLAYENGLQTELTMMMPITWPDQNTVVYSCRDLDEQDTSATNYYVPYWNASTGRWNTLYENLFMYYDDIFEYVIRPEMTPVSSNNKIAFVNIWGDFDPFGSNNINGTCVYPSWDNGSGPIYPNSPDWTTFKKWYYRIWPRFTSSYTYLPVDRKTIELPGRADPLDSSPSQFSYYQGVPYGQGVIGQIGWLRAANIANNWPQPGRYSFQAYYDWYKMPNPLPPFTWAPRDRAYWAYRELLVTVGNTYGGLFMIDEVGFTHDPANKTNTSDGAEGYWGYAGLLSAVHDYTNGIPVGIYEYRDEDQLGFGLTKVDGSLTQGAPVVSCYFLGNSGCP